MKVTKAGWAQSIGARAYQEDTRYFDLARGVFAVFDGLGGEAHGDDASKAAVVSLSKQVEAGNTDYDSVLTEMNSKVLDSLGGTTMTLAVFGGEFITLHACGDSYIFADKVLINPLDEDHWGAISSCMGFRPDFFRPHRIDLYRMNCNRIVLASDGIGTYHHEGVQNDDILNLLFDTPDPQRAADLTVAACLAKFGAEADNCTVIVIDVPRD